jgi:TonB family protein
MKLCSLVLLAVAATALAPSTRADADTHNPQVIQPVPPDYPDALRKAGVSGTVIVKFGLDDKGMVLNPTVPKPGNPDLDALAVAAVKRWTFAPAMKDGHAIAVKEMQVPITFALKPTLFQTAPSFAAALKRAGDEHKIVLIDFFTTWCEPCKRLDHDTWEDPAVIALVSSKAIALKVDAEQSVELAAHYHVTAYPTIALIRPDGTAIDTLVGYRDAATFRKEFTAILAGHTTLDQANEAVQQAGANPDDLAKARLDLAQAKERNGDYAGALADFLWCFDTGMKPPSNYVGVRLSFLLSDIVTLGHTYPTALEALRSRRDEDAKSLEGDEHAVQDYVALNRALGEEATSLAALDALPPGSPARTSMARWLFDPLLAAKRYKEAAGAFPAAQFESRFAAMAGPAATNPALHDYVVHFSAKEIEALAGAGQLADAKNVVGLLESFDPSEATKGDIAERLTRAGHPELIPSPAAAPVQAATSPAVGSK